MRAISAPLGIGGVAAAELARCYGTPLLAFDTDRFDARLAELEALALGHRLEVAYAAKALLPVALAARLARSNLLLDVCSLGELIVAERARFPAARIVLHGCGKSGDELDAACAGRVGRLVVDGAEELAALAARARAERPLAILLRLNPGVAAQTHAAVRTGDGDSKFGFGEHELEAPLATARRTPGLRLLGIHVHLGSQIFAQGPYLEALARALSAYRCVLASGAPGGVLVIGGGFGVDPLPGAAPFALADTLAALAAALDGACAEASLVRPVLGIEPGRFLVAEAGISLYRVLALKDRGTRRFAIVDGSLADNPRPALYDAYHHPALASRESAAPLVETTVCGRSCENDELAAAPLPADLAPGDLLALATTGAYTFSMASNYNRFVRPPLVFAGGGTHRAVVRRESIDDLLRTELPCDAP